METIRELFLFVGAFSFVAPQLSVAEKRYLCITEFLAKNFKDIINA